MSVTREQVERQVSQPITDSEIRQLIEKHIDPNPGGFGVARARLRETGASVAAVIADLEAEDGNLHQTAEDFGASVESILAAVHFYWQHQAVIDAEITVRRSGFIG